MIRSFQGVLRHSSAVTRLLGFKGPQVVDGVGSIATPTAPLYDAMQPEGRALRAERLYSLGSLFAVALGDSYNSVQWIMGNRPNSGVVTIIEAMRVSYALQAVVEDALIAYVAMVTSSYAGTPSVNPVSLDTRMGANPAATGIQVFGRNQTLFWTVNPGAALSIAHVNDESAGLSYGAFEVWTQDANQAIVLRPNTYCYFQLGTLAVAANFLEGNVAFEFWGYERPIEPSELTLGAPNAQTAGQMGA